MDINIPPLKNEYTRYLYYTSYLVGISSMVSFYHRDYTTFVYMFILFLTSINYWNNPAPGWRRDIDKFVCKIINVYFYETTLFFQNEFRHQVFVNTLWHVLFLYFLEWIYFYYQNPSWIIIHMMLHFYLSFSVPFVLYIL